MSGKLALTRLLAGFTCVICALDCAPVRRQQMARMCCGSLASGFLQILLKLYVHVIVHQFGANR